jgi:PilZ domain
MRSYIRHPSDIPIEYQADEQAEGAGQEHLNNFSAGGLSFTSAHALTAGSLITIRISNVEPDFVARAQVAWCRSEGDSFVVGVEFTESSDLFRARMVEQICHIEQYKAEVLAEEGRKIDGEEAAREWIKKFAQAFPRFDEDV